MDFTDLVKKRISVRRFRSDPVPQETIERILDAARWAPSGANRQPWKFLAVSDPAAKAEIRRHCEAADERWHANAPEWMKKFFVDYEIMPVKEYVTDVPWLICVFGQKGNPYWKESAWIAIAHILLATVAEGLGSLPYTPGQTRYLNRIFDVPDEFMPLAVLPVGHPEPALLPRRADHPRRALSEVASFDPPFHAYEPTREDDAPAPYGIAD